VAAPDLAHAAPEVILPDPQEWQQRDLRWRSR
jgi:hypothetical protein